MEAIARQIEIGRSAMPLIRFLVAVIKLAAEIALMIIFIPVGLVLFLVSVCQTARREGIGTTNTDILRKD